MSALVSELTALGAKGVEAEPREDWQVLPGKRPKSVVFSQWTAMLDLLEVIAEQPHLPCTSALTRISARMHHCA